jgi:hypothetical protein
MIPFTFEHFCWQSDFNGDEAGFPEVDVVGIYSYEAGDGCTYIFMIDVCDNRILNITKEGEEDIE